MSRSDGLHAREDALARRARGRYVGFTSDTRQIDSFIKAVSGNREGRKVTRSAARAALEIFNVETGENAADLNLNPSGKQWRKTLKRSSSYAYKISAKNNGSFSAFTGVNYKKAVLRISHLVERGFQHFRAGKVGGNWYRFQAFAQKRDEVLSKFMRNLMWGREQVGKTGKAPTAAQIRRNFQ